MDRKRSLPTPGRVARCSLAPGRTRSAVGDGSVTQMTLSPLLVAASFLAPGPAPFSPGEQMGFSIDYLGMRMGTATISVGVRAGPDLPVGLEAHTTGVAAVLFAFRERLTSFLDPESGLPATSVLDADERGRQRRDTTRFDREAGAAVVREGEGSQPVEVAVGPETLDFVALVFLLRRLPLEPGTRRSFSVLAGTKVQSVVAEVMEREEIRTPAGTFPALKIRVPTGFSGKFSERHPTYLWLSDDARRIVVRLATDFSFGSAAAQLVSYRPGEASGSGGGAP